jgi:hypothetical protein
VLGLNTTVLELIITNNQTNADKFASMFDAYKSNFTQGLEFQNFQAKMRIDIDAILDESGDRREEIRKQASTLQTIKNNFSDLVNKEGDYINQIFHGVRCNGIDIECAGGALFQHFGIFSLLRVVVYWVFCIEYVYITITLVRDILSIVFVECCCKRSKEQKQRNPRRTLLNEHVWINLVLHTVLVVTASFFFWINNLELPPGTVFKTTIAVLSLCLIIGGTCYDVRLCLLSCGVSENKPHQK